MKPGALRLLEAIEFSANVVRALTGKCVVGIEANEARCNEMVEQSLALATALAPVIGYDQAAEIAKEAYRSGKTIREIARARRVLPEQRLEALLNPWRMTRPGLSEKA